MRVLTVAGGNLFALAAAQLGDATQWIRLMQINWLDDPQLAGVTRVIIPDPAPAGTSGIAAQ